MFLKNLLVDFKSWVSKRVIITLLFIILQFFLFSQTTVYTFNFTGTIQNFTVPPCVGTLSVNVRGGKGGGANGGNGASVTGTLAVTPGQVLQVVVGGAGNCPAAGFNSGGPGASGSSASCGGGGLSRLGTALIAAGGGGRGGGTVSVAGGAGGCLTGMAGTTLFGGGGGGGTQIAGGAGGAAWGGGNAGGAGSLGLGGPGAVDPCFGTGPGGGGGGGFYGGGGGGSDCFVGGTGGGGGGGGGSSFTPAGGSCAPGINTGNGVITITVNLSPPPVITVNSATICQGASAVLTASGATSYTWQPGNLTGASVTVSPASSTIYTVTGLLGTCTGTTTSQVTVNSTVTASASSNNICSGSSVTLTGSGAISYTWNPGNITGNTAVVSPTANTTYTLTGINGACTSSTTISITVSSPPVISAFNLSGTICVGGTATLVASGALSFTWYPGSVSGNVVTVNPTISTTYTVIGAVGSCTGQTTLLVPVSNGPTITTVASPTAICPGGSSTLTASGALSYTWNPGGTISNSIIVSPAVTTIYSVTGIDAIGCTSTRTISLIVNPIPSVTVSPLSPSICVGSSITLIASGATSYSWNPGGLTGTSIVVSPGTTTTYTVVGSNGSCTNSVTKVVTVVPVPTVSASSSTTSICSGSSLTLTASGATTYTWNPGNLSGTNVTVSPTITTTYTVVGASGTCTDNAVITITVNNGPTLVTSASPTAVCPGNSSTLTSAGAVSYTWNPGASTGNTLVVTPASTSIYSVTGSTAMGCTTTQTVSVTVNPNPTVSVVASSASVCIGSSATLTASGATTYSWLPGSLTGSNIAVTPTINTTYTVTGSTSGCSGQSTITINVVPIPTVTAVTTPSAICNGGSATLTASGAVTYIWMPGSLTGSNVVVSPGVNTTFTVTGNNGICSSPATVALVVNPTPTIIASPVPSSICVSGNVTITASGASTYTWMPGSINGSSIVVSPTITSNYTVTGSSAFGCTASVTSTVVVNSVPVITLAATPTVVCNGFSSTLTAMGAASYTWMPGSLTGSNVVVTPTVTTNYTLTGATGACSTTGTITLIVNPSPTVTASANPTNICAGSSSTLTANGAVTYTWNPGNLNGTPVTVTPTATTIYTVTGSTALGCPGSTTVNLMVSPIPTIMPVANPTAICIGNSSTLTATGATSYSWNPGALTGSNVVVSPTVTTTYTINGNLGICSSTQTLNLVVNPLPTITATASSPTICAGQSTSLTASGASTYTWNPGPLTGSTVVVLPTITTIYTVNGTSSLSCGNTQTVSVTVNPLPTLTVTSTATNICAGGSATLTGGGGVSYFWNPGGIPGSPIVVSPSVTTTYTLFGTSGAGCVNTFPFTLSVTPVPTITAVSNPTTICIGNSSTLTATGAISYSWNPGALTGSNVVVTPTVTTTYTINGANGICSSTQTLNLIVNPLPTVTATASSPTICAGQSTSLTASGASAYTWNPGPLTGSTVVVSPTITTTYTVIGANSFGCGNTQTVSVTVNSLPTLTITPTATNICAGSSATLTGSGAASYVWNPGGAGTSIVVSPSVTTTYTLTGTSGAGCVNTLPFTLSVTPVPTITAISNPTAVCIGNSATLTANGATTYSWNPGALTGSNVAVTPATTTVYTVTGANGICGNTQTVSVNVNSLPVLTASASSPTICSGNTTSLTVTGASTYTWLPGYLTGSMVSVSPTITTTYSVTGTNTSGCTASTTVLVNVNPLPTLSITSTATNICSGNSATLTASGANSYTWNPGALTTTIITVTPSVTTQYTLTGSSAAGCTNTALFTLSVTPTPTLTAIANPTAICFGNSSTLTATGATSYTWNPGALTGSNVVVTPASTTTYTLAGANGICISTRTVAVIVYPAPFIAAAALPSVICAGATSSLGALGGTTFTWNPGALTGSMVTVTPPITTSYTVVTSNTLGCTSSTVITVTVNPIPTLTISSTATAICSGGSATLTGSGASSYTWSPGGATTSTLSVNPLVTTVYTLTGNSAAGCTNSSSFTLNINPTPTVTASANNTLICSGNSSTLSATGAGSYTWNPGSITGTNVIVSPSVTTSYTLTGANGACTSTAGVTVSVTTSPSISVVSNPTILCSGSNATLTAGGASTYTWLPIGVFTSTAVVNPTVTTNYTVTGSIGNNCSQSIVFTLTVTPTPTVTASANTSVICSGNSAILSANGAGSYIWNPGVITGTNIVVTPSVTTSYTVTGANGNCSSNAVITITVNSNPTITATASSTIICAGSTVTLTANGGLLYAWLPGSVTGSMIATTPTVTTTYTVSGSNANGCNGTGLVTVSVNPIPNVSVASSPTGICIGGTATLVASGANTYTWMPGSLNGNTLAVTPTATTIYTVTGADLAGCSDTKTVQMIVLQNPTVTIASTPTALCEGSSATLTANGAITYSWLPGTATGSVIVVTPTITSTYTVTGANGSCGTGTSTISLTVNTAPSVTAAASTSISCSTPSVSLLGSSSSTNSSFAWSGPGGFTTSVQSPTGIAIPGNYTLNVIDMNTGCSSSSTVAVTTDSSVPNVTATVTGSITCTNPNVGLSASSSATNVSYTWNGPAGFTITSASFTTSTGGTYTVTVTNLDNNCPASTLVTVSSNTAVPITATMVPATCSGTMANNDGSILAGGFGSGDKYDLVAGLSYTGTATYTTAIIIPGNGVLINTLNNPLIITPYTVRLFAANGCYKDTTLYLVPTSCITNTVFGVAKAVSTPTLKTNGTYDVNYYVVVKNTGAQQLNNIALTENLAATFPLPTTYSIVGAPVVTSLNSSLTINAAFDGSVQTIMTNTTTSMLAPGKTDTIMFTINLTHNGNFGPFNNTVIGFSSPTVGVVFADSSNTGYDPDPDADGDPTNNNIPTILNLTPNLFFGLTKQAELSEKLSDNTWDITYTITVHNLGNDTLRNVSIKDDLFNNTIKQPATYNIKSGPTASGNLVANTAFDGNSDINLLIASQSKIAPGVINTIVFKINVSPDTVTIVKNSAFGTAVNTTSITVSDTSNTGSDPDSNNNGVWNEAADNIPTLITIPNNTLFIPGGFSPDGDLKNDVFVIKGLSTVIENNLTVYNRWGNKVYTKDNYDNTWDGHPNVSGTFGSEKLPPGTYYYILEFKGGDLKPIPGFVVIQY